MTHVIYASGAAAAPVVAPPPVVADAAGGFVSDLIPEPISRFFAVVGDGAVWKRVGVIALGVWLVYIGVLVWIASNEQVQQTVGAAVGAAVTKNPTALAAAV